jgi:hypothetical protein
MSSDDLDYYIKVRGNYLSSDEILYVLDMKRNPCVDHIVYENYLYTVWCTDGKKFEFRMRL